MKKILALLALLLLPGRVDVYSQAAPVPQIKKATVIVDFKDRQKIRGQATIAIGRGRFFSRPQNQFQKALSNISEQMNNMTEVYTNEYARLQLSSDLMQNIPFVIITTDDAFELTFEETDNIRNYLENGGFIYCENVRETANNSPVEQSFINMIVSTLGENATFGILENDDPLLHSFYDFDEGPPVLRRNGVINYSPLQTVRYKGRMVAVYSNRAYSLEWNKPAKNTLPLKFAVNMIIFAITRDGANTIRH